MDDFSLDRPELDGAVMSLEFGPGGRIHQMWIDDPNGATGSEDVQFVLPPLSLDDDFVDDYLPGAILIGARTRPDDPWIVSRNTEARIVGEGDDLTQTTFEYEFSLLPEIVATGHFYERPGPIPQVVWDLTIENRGKVSLEIGELGLPFALNNMYANIKPLSRGSNDLSNRFAIHPCFAGAASYVHAQRLSESGPGLVICPGEDTVWEAYASVPSTLKGLELWPGIPIAYIYSRATVDREGWPEWFNGASSLVMEPGDVRRYQTVFLPCDGGEPEAALGALVSAGRPTIGLWPGAVAPAEVGIFVQVAGATPTQVYSDREAELDADSEDGHGSCQITPKEPGPMRFSFEDTEGRTSWANVLFTEPIEQLIKKRASWIVEHQAVHGGPFDGAIVLAGLQTGQPLNDPEDFQTPFGLESSLSDALFLAEKNRYYPVAAEMAVLERYLHFIQRRIQNPATFEVMYAFDSEKGPAIISSAPHLGRLLAQFYLAYGLALGEDKVGHYFELAQATVAATRLSRTATRTAQTPAELVRELGRRAAVRSFRDDATDITLRSTQVWSSLAPNWWWYGSHAAPLAEERGPNRAVSDKGEICLGPVTTARCARELQYLEKDRAVLPVGKLRMALGGLLGVWALVRNDGAASHGFCPDLASEQFGMSQVTGTVGQALYYYLSCVSAYIDPTTDLAFGAFYSQEKEWGKVTPWDGVGRRVVIRAYGLVAESDYGVIREFRFKRDRTEAVVRIENPAKEARPVKVRVRGLWGTNAKVNGEPVTLQDGWLNAEVSCDGESVAVAEIRIQK